MSDAGAPESSSDGAVECGVEITGSGTVVRVAGERDAAVIVRSASGERIYLPPENFDEPVETTRQTPYESPARSSPYQSASGSYDSPYRSSADESAAAGIEATPDGFRIVHPERITDFRLLRDGQDSAASSRTS